MYGNFTCIVVEIRLTGIQKAGLRTKIYLILLKNLINSALSYRWGCRDAGKSARNFASWMGRGTDDREPGHNAGKSARNFASWTERGYCSVVLIKTIGS